MHEPINPFTPQEPHDFNFLIFFFGVLALLLFMIFAFKDVVRAEEFTDTQIVNAIYHAEGGHKAQYAYGIRSVKYATIAEARRICFNTVRNNHKRFAKQKKYTDYLEYLASRYCPVSAHPLNKFWLKNVRYYLARQA